MLIRLDIKEMMIVNGAIDEIKRLKTENIKLKATIERKSRLIDLLLYLKDMYQHKYCQLKRDTKTEREIVGYIDMRDKCFRLEKQNKQLQAEQEMYQNDLQEKDAEIARLRKDNAEYSKDVDTLIAYLEKANARVAELEQEADTLGEKYAKKCDEEKQLDELRAMMPELIIKTLFR